MVSLPNRILWIVTGNNLQMSNEIVRRTVRIRLDALMEDPSTRDNFRHPSLSEWVIENRSDLVWAALILIQNWIATGKASFAERTLGSFERWAQVIGGIMQAADISGFLQGRDALRADADEETAQWKDFVGAWHRTHGDKSLSTAELFDLAKTHLDGVLGDGDERSQRTRLGKVLRKHRGRVFSRYKITATDKVIDQNSRSRNGWMLTQAMPPDNPSGASTTDQRWDVGGNGVEATDLPFKSSSVEPPNVDDNNSAAQKHVGDNKRLIIKENLEISQRPNVAPSFAKTTSGVDEKQRNGRRDAEIDRLTAADANTDDEEIIA
jgi:hypothetical protein